MIKMLSIIIPVYNEESTILKILEKIVLVSLINNIQKEIIVVNDCSTDNTGIKIEDFIVRHTSESIKYVSHKINRGKGAAIKTGISLAEGEYLIIQDADTEYDPAEYNILLKPVIDGFADVVYGSRFIGSNPHRVLFFWHRIGNKFLTNLTNLFSNVDLTDMETCFKLFNTNILKSVRLVEDRFGFEPEVTIKIARIPGIRIYEVGVSYYGRSYSEGKKIRWVDGIRAVYCILKYGLFRA